MGQRESDVEASTYVEIGVEDGWHGPAQCRSGGKCWGAGAMLTPIDLSVVWENSMGMWEGPASTTLDRSVGGSGAARCRERCRESRGFRASTTLYISLALGHALVEALQLYSSETPLQLYSSTPLYSIHPLQHPSLCCSG